MSSTEEIKSFIGLNHKTVNLLMNKSCIRITRLANTLLVMEGAGHTLSMAYCGEYESLLLERLDMCRKLNEFYVEDRKHSCWLYRWLIDRHIIQVSQLHKETLSQLMLLRNYMALHDEKGKFID